MTAPTFLMPWLQMLKSHLADAFRAYDARHELEICTNVY